MLLTLCMVLGLLPGMTLTASAAEDTASTGCTYRHDESCGEEDPDEPEAVTALRARIDALPTGEAYRAMTADEQDAVYEEAAEISDEYFGLSEEERALVDITALEELFAVMNEDVAVMTEAGIQYEEIAIAKNSLNGNAIWGVTESTSGVAMDNYAYFYSESKASSGGLPNDGKLKMSSGVFYTLAAGEDSATAYDGNDCIRLTANKTSQTMSLETVGVYQNVYVLATAGGPGTGHYADFKVTLTYTEGEPEETTYKLYDWFDTRTVPGVEKYNNVMRMQIGTTSTDGSTSAGPVLHSATIKVDRARLLKAITFTMNGKDGNSSAMSGLYCCIFAVTGATPAGVPDAPVATAATKTDGDTSGAFTANWKAVDGATGYLLDVATDRKFTELLPSYNNKDVGDSTSYQVSSDVSSDVTYYYRVRAVNNQGQSLSSNRISTDLPNWLKAALNSSDYDKVTYNAETNTVTFGNDVTLKDTITLPTDDTTVINLGGSTVTAPVGKPAISAGTGRNVELTVTGDGTSGRLVGNGTTESGNGAPVIDFSGATGSSKVAVGNSAVSGSSGSNADSGTGGRGGAGIAASNSTQVEVGSGATVTGGNGGSGTVTGGDGGAGISGGNVIVSSGGTVTNGSPGSTHIHRWAYTVSGNKIMAYCEVHGVSGCAYQGEEKAVTLTLTADNAAYSGSAYSGASVTNNITPVTNAAAGSIFYQGTGTTTYESSATPPTDCGTYQASVTVGGQTATAYFMITQRTINPSVTMVDYEYGSTPSTPSINANGSGGTVTVYYSAYSDIVTNPAHRLEWKDITGTTLNVGTYYMIAHVAGTHNFTEGTTDLITFQVTRSSYAAPIAPTVSDFTVTIGEADREKDLEYAVVTQGSDAPTGYVPVPALNSSGSFDLTGLAESTNYTIYLRQKASADGNYAASDPVSANFTTPYSVAYNANYGSGTVPASVTQNSGSSVIVDSGSGLWRTGYTFNGWNTKADGRGTGYAAGATINTGATLYAQWTPNTYTVKFNANDGAGPMADQDFTYDVKQALTANAFTRTGYTFTGWKDDGNTYTDGQKVKNLTAEPDGTVTLYAQWEAKNDTPYTVKHYLENLNGSYALDTTEHLEGKTDATVTAAAKSYDNFTYDSTVLDTVASGNIAGDGSLVLKLFYTRNTYDYTVRHIKQLPDGSYDEANAEVETLSGKFEALAAVTAKDYGSHYPTNDADTKQNIKIEKGLTIDVKYDLDEHTLTFETNGGSAINPVTVRHGNAVARPADPTKDKYTFIGWYADPEFTEEYDFATVLEADKTIYAKFELTSAPIGDIYVRYDVLHIKQLPDGTYDLANAEVEHLSAKKDTTVTAVIKDYRATHHVNVNRTLSKLTDTAIRPYPGPDGKPVYTILTVYYDLDFHTLTFETNGGSKIAPETVRHGLTVAKPKDPVNGGYIFDGWYTDKTFRHRYDFSTPLTEDITIYAKWSMVVLPNLINKKAPKLNTTDHFAYVQGYPNGTVKPTGNITRAETAAILFRLMDEDSRKTYYSTKSGFRDVATGSWYNTYVATLNNAGVITDSSNGYFRPNETITRAELAAMLAQFADTKSAPNYFTDVTANYWAANAIAVCAKLGWINGYPDGSFRPDATITRAEMMAMINRALDRTPKSVSDLLSGMKTWSDNANTGAWYYLDVQEATNSHTYTKSGTHEAWKKLR